MFQNNSTRNRTKGPLSSFGRLRQHQRTSSRRRLLHQPQLRRLEQLWTTPRYHRMLFHREDGQERMWWTCWWRKVSIHTLQSDAMFVTEFSRAKNLCKLTSEHTAEKGRTFATSQTVEKPSSRVASWRLINACTPAKNHLLVQDKVAQLDSPTPIAIVASIHMQASNASSPRSR